MKKFDNDYAINHITYKGQSGCNKRYYCRRLECMLASPSGEFCDRIVRGCTVRICLEINSWISCNFGKVFHRKNVLKLVDGRGRWERQQISNIKFRLIKNLTIWYTYWMTDRITRSLSYWIRHGWRKYCIDTVYMFFSTLVLSHHSLQKSLFWKVRDHQLITQFSRASGKYRDS